MMTKPLLDLADAFDDLPPRPFCGLSSDDD